MTSDQIILSRMERRYSHSHLMTACTVCGQKFCRECNEPKCEGCNGPLHEGCEKRAGDLVWCAACYVEFTANCGVCGKRVPTAALNLVPDGHDDEGNELYELAADGKPFEVCDDCQRTTEVGVGEVNGDRGFPATKETCPF